MPLNEDEARDGERRERARARASGGRKAIQAKDTTFWETLWEATAWRAPPESAHPQDPDAAAGGRDRPEREVVFVVMPRVGQQIKEP